MTEPTPTEIAAFISVIRDMARGSHILQRTLTKSKFLSILEQECKNTQKLNRSTKGDALNARDLSMPKISRKTVKGAIRAGGIIPKKSSWTNGKKASKSGVLNRTST